METTMKHLELSEDACNMLAQCIKHRIDFLSETNQLYVDMRTKGIWGDDVAQKYKDNATRIGELKTLLDYINS